MVQWGLWVLMIAGGAALLFLGAEWLVRGGAGLARRLGVSPLIIGLTVVAYGTSAPELVVGLQAGWTGHGDIAFGNVVGSNIANFGLILGLTALLKPVPVQRTMSRIDVPVLMVATLATLLLFLDGRLTPWESALLLAMAFGYSLWMVRRAGSLQNPPANHEGMEPSEEPGSVGQGGSWARLAAWVMAGLILLVLGGALLVQGASHLAVQLGMSERLVGLTIVAVGTSLPELATSLVAARRGHGDMAVGNVVGSNIFNLLLCLGAAGLPGRIAAEPTLVNGDLIVLALLTALTWVLLRTERLIRRSEGGLLVVTYALYVSWSVWKG